MDKKISNEKAIAIRSDIATVRTSAAKVASLLYLDGRALSQKYPATKLPKSTDALFAEITNNIEKLDDLTFSVDSRERESKVNTKIATLSDKLSKLVAHANSYANKLSGFYSVHQTDSHVGSYSALLKQMTSDMSDAVHYSKTFDC